MAAGSRTSITSRVSPQRSMIAPWPENRPPAGRLIAVVTPAMRVTGMTMEFGFSPSDTRKPAATRSSCSGARMSLEGCTASISTNPRFVPESMKPGVTIWPLASMRIAP